MQAPLEAFLGCFLLYSSRNTPSCLSQVRRGDSRYCGTIWLLIAWECFENEQSNKLLKLHLDVTCNGIKLHSSYYWLQDDKVTAVFLATSLFAAPAELSSYDSTLLDGMVGICLHEDGLALSSEQKFGYCWRISTQALSILCFLPSLEETDVAYGTVSGVVEGTAVATANIATAVLRTALDCCWLWRRKYVWIPFWRNESSCWLAPDAKGSNDKWENKDRHRNGRDQHIAT